MLITSLVFLALYLHLPGSPIRAECGLLIFASSLISAFLALIVVFSWFNCDAANGEAVDCGRQCELAGSLSLGFAERSERALRNFAT